MVDDISFDNETDIIQARSDFRSGFFAYYKKHGNLIGASILHSRHKEK